MRWWDSWFHYPIFVSIFPYIEYDHRTVNIWTHIPVRELSTINDIECPKIMSDSFVFLITIKSVCIVGDFKTVFSPIAFDLGTRKMNKLLWKMLLISIIGKTTIKANAIHHFNIFWAFVLVLTRSQIQCQFFSMVGTLTSWFIQSSIIWHE